MWLWKGAIYLCKLSLRDYENVGVSFTKENLIGLYKKTDNNSNNGIKIANISKRKRGNENKFVRRKFWNVFCEKTKLISNSDST